MNRKSIVMLVVALVFLAMIGYGISFLATTVVSAATQPSTATTQSTVLAAPKLGTVTDMESAMENIYTQVNPSVVAIDVVSTQQQAHPNVPGFRGGLPSVPQAALGSGFVWDTQGHIVTNNHVIDGADRIAVTFSDGSTAAAKLVATDPAGDLAVIQVNVPASRLHPVQIADSTQLKVGQFAIAIGNPFGEQNTMTTGIISALGRSFPAGDTTTPAPSYTIPDVIQTDAPINPGNSGGVLLNTDGKVIGVTFAIESPAGTSAGIGFAIPSAIVQKIVPALISTGHFDHPYLGISGATLNSETAQAMNLSADQRGALVIDVTPNSPAQKAGLRGSTRQQTTSDGSQIPVGGDVITAIEGQAVKSFDDVVAYLARSTNVNQTVTLTILRDGKSQSVPVTLGARPSQ